MPRTRNPYPTEFREQLIALTRGETASTRAEHTIKGRSLVCTQRRDIAEVFKFITTNQPEYSYSIQLQWPEMVTSARLNSLIG